MKFENFEKAEALVKAIIKDSDLLVGLTSSGLSVRIETPKGYSLLDIETSGMCIDLYKPAADDFIKILSEEVQHRIDQNTKLLNDL